MGRVPRSSRRSGAELGRDRQVALLGACVTALLTVLWATPALADESSVSASLALRGPGACASAGELAAAVEARLDRAVFVEEAPDVAVEVRIEAHEGGIGPTSRSAVPAARPSASASS